MAKKSAVAPAAQGGALPISSRTVDLLISFYYIVFLFTVTFTDLHNFTASILGVEVKDLEHMELAYPPKFLTDLYFKWARSVDPLLYENPMWWQSIEWVNLLFLMPFSVVAIIGFPMGWNGLRNWGIISSAFTFYSLVVIIAESLFGKVVTPDPQVFMWVYIPYAIFPLLVIIRLWGDKPFSSRMSGLAATFVWFVGTITLALFFTYSLKWFVKYDPDLLPAEVLAFVKEPLSQLP